MTSTPKGTIFDATKPLRNPKWEQFAREAACLTQPLEAMKIAGFAKPRAGNAARLLRNRKIEARIAALAENDVEMVRYRRARLRRVLDHIGTADRTELFEHCEDGEVEVPIVDWNGNVVRDANGNVKTTFEQRTLRFKRLDELSPKQRLLIDSIELTKYGPMPVMPARLQALAQLARLDGLDKPAKVAPTNPEGDGPPVTVLRWLDPVDPPVDAQQGEAK
jgi:hypothetical protein